MTLLPVTRFPQSHFFLPEHVCDVKGRLPYFSPSLRSGSVLMAVLIATGGLGLAAQGVFAQTNPNIQVDSNTGAVEVDNNAFDIRTGAFDNTSNIPRPADLPVPSSIQEGAAQEVVPNTLAPNTVEITPDVDFINQSFNELVNNGANGFTYQLDPESLNLTTQFNLNRIEGQHSYGEGIEVTVSGPNGTETFDPVFVRGDVVQRGPDNQVLPESAQVNVQYGAEDTVELRVLNLRRNNSSARESAIYFDQDGQFIVEDLQNGGDLDFNDGEYVEISGGQGEASAIEENTRNFETTRVEERDLPPEMREERLVERDIIEGELEFDTVVQEEREWGQIDYPNSAASSSFRLGHAVGAVGAGEQQLVYDLYSSAAEFRAGSDGISLTGQLPPLIPNPAVPPTLLSGTVAFNPTVGDNQAGLTATVGITQFLTPTHRLATDLFGSIIAGPNPEGQKLVEPVGLFNNNQLVGFVPTAPSETVVSSEPVTSFDGIFELPSDQGVVITPADPQSVGRGNADYTDNVGGLLVELATGDMNFLPQWNRDGYVQDPISFEPGEVQRIIYALVPQQRNQDLQLGETYAVTESVGGHRIADGGFFIISADRHPENFAQESAEVYAVEDTLPGNNAVTAGFNGVRGLYAEEFGGIPVPTVDVTVEPEVDARVGNTLLPLNILAGDVGQQPYSRTTVSAGFFVSGSFTTGVGNQRNTVRRTTTTTAQVTDQLRVRETVNRFMTPRRQRDVITLLNTEVTRSTGTASFDIDNQGLLGNVVFTPNGNPTSSLTTQEVGRDLQEIRGTEVPAADPVVTETITAMETRMISTDQTTAVESESYANLAPVEGEITLGSILNFGNTPWSQAANTLRAELFARDTVIGLGNGSEVGWRAEVVFHPFGEVMREAFQYDSSGNVTPVYQTEALLDSDGKQVMQTLTDENGKAVELPVNRFAQDDSGNRIAQMVGTGRAQGPGIYLRVEDIFSGSDGGPVIAGGFQFSF